jgi:Mg2+ and Co2+ transporter CorA
MSSEDVSAITSNPRAMIFRMTQIICSDWLILSRYIMARLGQIEWELERPDFRPDSNKIDASLAKLHTWRRRLPLYKSMVLDTEYKLFSDMKPGDENDCISKMKKDFEIVSHNLQDLYERTERIATVATAVTSIEESRRGMDQNRALGRLTYLAVIFAPLSFVSSFFSMAGDISQLSQTFWIYFTVAIPLSIVAFLLVDPTVLLMLERFIPGKKKKEN